MQLHAAICTIILIAWLGFTTAGVKSWFVHGSFAVAIVPSAVLFLTQLVKLRRVLW